MLKPDITEKQNVLIQYQSTSFIFYQQAKRRNEKRLIQYQRKLRHLTVPPEDEFTLADFDPYTLKQTALSSIQIAQIILCSKTRKGLVFLHPETSLPNFFEF